MQVYSYVFTIVKNQSLAEEITQNTFYKAMTARRQYEGKAGEPHMVVQYSKESGN